MLVLAGRLFQLQILESHVYRDLAEDNRIDVRLLPPRRGIIYDRNGTPIALNSPNYSINIVAEEAGDLAKAFGKLSAIIPMSDRHIMEKIAEIGERPEFLPVTVAENVTWQQVAAVSANSPALPGISADVGTTRFYPFGHEFAHLVGYVGRVSAKDREDAKNEDPLLDLPQFEIGKIGLRNGLIESLEGNRAPGRSKSTWMAESSANSRERIRSEGPTCRFQSIRVCRTTCSPDSAAIRLQPYCWI